MVNDDSKVVNKLETSLTDDARVVIYDRHMFIVQTSGDICFNDNYFNTIHSNDIFSNKLSSEHILFQI